MIRYLFLFLFLISLSAHSQEIHELDSLVKIGKASLANQQLSDKLEKLISDSQEAKLPSYLEVYGRIQTALMGDEKATLAVEGKLKEWSFLLPNPQGKKDLWLAASSWYEYAGITQEAENSKFKALEFARKQENISDGELGTLLVSLAAFSINRMDIPKAKGYLKEAQVLLDNDPDPESVYRLNSFSGNLAYFASKLDSAEFYYKRCLEAFKTMDPTLRNTHYRPAIILNNLSGVQSALGKTADAINSMNQVISLNQYYIDHEPDPAAKMRAREFYFQALDNLAGIYRSLGNYEKAEDLLEFSYKKKQAELNADSKDIWLSEIILGQLYYDQYELEKARKMLLKGLEGLQKSNGEYTIYEADAWYALGRIEDTEGNEVLAEKYYRIAYGLLKKDLGQDFNLTFLDFSKNFSKFLAENKKKSEAVSVSNQAYAYILSTIGKTSLMAFEQELSIGEIYLELEEYTQAEKWVNIAIKNLNQQRNGGFTALDSIRNDRLKPQAILLKNKTRFLKSSAPTLSELNEIISELENGLKVIERSKSYFDSEEDLGFLLKENENYFSFLEQMYLELYKLSPDQEYLSKLLVLHESALYQKIRMRIGQMNISSFGTMPKDFFRQEGLLKSKVSASISEEEDDIQGYQQAIADWEDFLKDARAKYPAYYAFRYASLIRPIQEIWDNIPKEKTVVRYLIVDEKLLALVLTGGAQEISLFELDYPMTLTLAQDYQKHWNNEKATLDNLHSLYEQLWKPFSKHIQTSSITVVPDGFLFNLNFELLTPETLSSYTQFAKGSLLAKHSFSYNYSTLLFSYPTDGVALQSNFVAFAPGFFDEMKKSYLSSVKDTFNVDHSYLNLIPQPFTEQLVRGLEDNFGGTVYSKQASTLSHFSEEVGKHKIIHIGTHAESNNMRPEFSRLIFAKNSDEEENSLYAKDIYEMDLRSELAILMACETGKPSYQPGEGMVSLAHAFNYAGSKSLLIGLWKIDEKASSAIAESFYSYLSQGMQKDESLRLAKLDYLASTKGRALSPEFWAGLVLIGNSEQINIESKSNNNLILIFSGVFFLGLLHWFFVKGKK